ncbi:MAG: cyclic beta 1-2 glucan synthetase, partial [Lentisphaerae bacterium]|nr:cyclic beta 1-2 glucan synthetase [Lentisphaerota bacterium]
DRATIVHLITGVAETREAALALIDKYHDRHFVDRAFDMAWSHSQVIMRQLNVTEAETQLYGRLAGSIFFAHARHRASPSIIAKNRLGQKGLWRFGISGDLPIMLLRIGDIKRMDRVHDALRAHVYWRLKGLIADLVILNEDYSGYRAVLNEQIMAAITAGPDADMLDKPGGVFIRRSDILPEEDCILLQTVARVVLADTAETLQEQVDRRVPPRRLPPAFRPSLTESQERVSARLRQRERIFENGLGGFTPDGREYVILLEPGQTTPAPWANVIASPRIGTIVSESGGMYTWAGNAHEFRITPWYNDPVTDASGEAVYLRDEETGRFWSLTPLPAPGRSGTVCRHGFGYSVFEHDESGVFTEAWVYVAMDAPVKFVVVKVRNHSGRMRRLSLTAFFELVLGEWRHGNAMHIITETDPQTGAIFARNSYSREFADCVVFASCSELERSVTGSRAEFLGRNGDFADPAAMHRTRLSNVTGAGFDPGAGMQTTIGLADGQSRDIVFILGATDNAEEAHMCVTRFGGPAGARDALEEVWAHWNHTLDSVYVETPDTATNVLVNGWLLYQALSCRLWGRSGYYQSGGAYGFRDQIQDAMALVHTAPYVLREQLLLCAAHQFREGDVQHWWHPPGGAGVRTHFSDDFLWLPQAVVRYIQTTGDTGVLDESVPFLEGRPVNVDEESYYEEHAHASETGTLYEHCVRALRRGLRFGLHGLPLIGCGDWNDGMSLVGSNGKGESVWLAWFLQDALVRFTEVARLRGDAPFADFCDKQAISLLERIEATAWDGAWYRRAYFDDGTPLGSAENDECQIDSLSQSWAVISGGAQPERARQAMESVVKYLVRRDDGLIRLFTPPFDLSDMEPGYIKGYPSGMRENGGQYTHGAIWSVMALALLGEHDRAWNLFRMLNPILHSDTVENIKRYRVEPYVMAADVYSIAPHIGRGGWTWYTGAAGWMYRLAVEVLLGVELHNDHLRLTPRLPSDNWSSYSIRYRYRETTYHINVRKSDDLPTGAGICIVMDDIEQPDNRIQLCDDRHDHYVNVAISH